MPKTITLYYIDELDENAKKKAIEHIRYSGRCIDEEDLTNYFESKLRKFGFPCNDINWSLGYCQGDGVAFYGVIPDLLALVQNRYKRDFSEDEINELIKLGIKDACWEIVRNSYGHHYSHCNTMTIETDNFFNPTSKPNVVDTLEQIVKEDIKNISKEFEAYGYGYIEESEKDERCIELALENELLYTATGKPFIP